MGMKWKFPCGRWLAKGKDDGKLERELYLATEETEEYAAKVPYEITGKKCFSGFKRRDQISNATPLHLNLH